jgi:hypothetical protein
LGSAPPVHTSGRDFHFALAGFISSWEVWYYFGGVISIYNHFVFNPYCWNLKPSWRFRGVTVARVFNQFRTNSGAGEVDSDRILAREEVWFQPGMCPPENFKL